MGTIRKIGEEYFIEFFARGLKYQQKAGPSRLLAEKTLKDIEDKIARGEASLIVRDVDIDIFFQDFCESIKDTHTPKTIERYRKTVQDFTQYLRLEHPSLQKISEITPRIIESYKACLLKKSYSVPKITPRIINFTILLLHEILDYAIKLGYLNDNPSLHIKLIPTPPSKRLIILSEAEVHLLLHALDQDLRPIIQLMFLTGITLREAVDLKWDQIDRDNFVLPASTGAVEGFHRIPLDIKARMILQEKKQAAGDSQMIFTDAHKRKWTIEDLKEKFEHAVKIAGLTKRVSPSGPRHYFAAALIRKKVPLASLYKILGFSDIARVMIYSDLLVENWRVSTGFSA